MAEEKAFKPSKKKLEKARQEGQVLKSPYMTQLVVMIAIFCAAWIVIPRVWVAFRMLLECNSAIFLENPVVALTLAARETVVAILILGGVGGLTAMLAEACQVGFRVESGILTPKFDRLALNVGLKKICDTGVKQSLVISLRAAILMVLLGLAIWQSFLLLSSLTLGGAQAFAGLEAALLGVLKMCLAASAALAVADYLIRRRTFYRELSMSHQDLRDENKNEEGDPMIKAARRSLHESLALQDLIRRVRASKVIVVEPHRRAKSAGAGHIQ